MAKRSYKWHRWSECLPEVEPDGCSEFVEVCHKGCYPQIACWNTNFDTPFWQTNSFEPLFSKKDLKHYIDQSEVWWRYIEYPKE